MSFLEEKPSREFRDRVFAAAEAELLKNRSSQREWTRRLVLAGGFLAAVVAVTSQVWIKWNSDSRDELLTSLDDGEMFENSEVLDDLEFFEDLAEMEDWDGFDS